MKHDIDQSASATGEAQGKSTRNSEEHIRKNPVGSDPSPAIPAPIGAGISESETAAIFSALMGNTDYAIITTDAKGIITTFGAGAEKMLGYSSEDVVGRFTPDVFHDSEEVHSRAERLSKATGRTIPPIAAVLLTSLPDEAPSEREWTMVRKDGVRLPTLISVAAIRSSSGGVAGHVGIVHDISNLRKVEDALRQSERALRTVMDATPVVLFAMDRHGVFTLSEGKGLERLGLRTGEVVGKSLFDLYVDYPDMLDTFRQVLQGEHRKFLANIRGVVFQNECVPVFDDAGEVIGLIGSAYDVTERWQAEQRIQEYNVVLEFQKRELEKANEELAALATMDDLTGLKNQRFFRERLAEEVSRSKRYGTAMTLILLDVDRFKNYNDTFGHSAGDGVLRDLGRLLKEGARETDIAARYGGEEFALILPLTDIESAAAIAERLRVVVEQHPWIERPVTISVGVAAWNSRMQDVRSLVDCADAALYAAKANGRNAVSIGEAATDRSCVPDQSVRG